MPPALGEVWRHSSFYQNSEGTWLPKFMLVLGFTAGNDVVIRLLTSQATLRADQGNPCSHDLTRPGYFLGVLDANRGLGSNSWVDLRYADDIDDRAWDRTIERGVLTSVLTLQPAVLCPLLVCAMSAPDTERQQEKSFANSRQLLGC